MNHFPDITRAISTDSLRPVMNYAIVQDGRIIATNSHILVNISLNLYIEDEEQLSNIEGKIFNLKLLKKLILKKWDKIVFRKDNILFQEKDGFTEFGFYSGTVTPENKDRSKMELYNPLTESYSDLGHYVNWRAVVPMTDKNKLKIDGTQELKEANFSLRVMEDAVKSFSTDKIRMISTGNGLRPLIVTPCALAEYQYEEFSEYAMVMPIRVD